MKFPFSLFGRKPEAQPPMHDEPEEASAPFPVELAVAQVQAATGMRFGQRAVQHSELQEAAGVLALLARPAETLALTLAEPVPEPSPQPQAAPAPASTVAEEVASAPADPVTAEVPTSPPPSETSAATVVGRDEVVAAYRMFLRRDPESEAVIAPRLGIARERLLSTFMVSPEFLQRAENVKLLLEVAKSLELRQAAVAPVPGIPVLTPDDVEAAKRIFWPEPHDQAMQPQPGETADRTLAHLMRSEHFQKNAFNAKLVSAVARQIVERLSQK